MSATTNLEPRARRRATPDTKRQTKRQMKRQTKRRVGLAGTLAAAALTAISPRPADALDRAFDPVVLEGSELVSFWGVPPADIVGFAWDGSSWSQIPIQIDERDIVDFATVYGDSSPSGFTFLTYTDSGTFTGPDADPSFDADDELVFMARDAGLEATTTSHPNAVVPNTGVELQLIDPLTFDVAYVYLFESGTLPPDAGQAPMSYQFQLLSGPYKTTYNTLSGPNPENTTLSTSAYSVHFSDRWIRDVTSVTVGASTGVDILDRHKSLFAPGNCARSEDTFSAGEGAFIVNRAGVVRTLRGYVGANSGPTTYRIHAFYDQREDIRTVLRVHAIGSVVDFYDYSADALGMTYHNDLNPSGVVIDGVPDAITPGQHVWELVTGAQGTLLMAVQHETDIPNFDYTTYYEDDDSTSVRQCTGDDFAYGSSGYYETDPIPNTDPGVQQGELFHFSTLRTLVFGGPNEDVSFAQARHQEIVNPLTVQSTPWPNATDVTVRGSRAFFSVVPNPAASRAEVRFGQTRPGRFEAHVYDVAGRRVATPVARADAVGAHVVEWNLGALPAGVYLVRWRGVDTPWRTSRFTKIR